MEDIGRAIEDDYATIRAKYREYHNAVAVWITVDGVIQKLPKIQSFWLMDYLASMSFTWPERSSLGFITGEESPKL